MHRCALATAAALIAGACTRPAPTKPIRPPAADAPYELTDTGDLAALRDRYLGLADGDGDELRTQLVGEYRSRAFAALEAGDQHGAFRNFTQLVSLFASPSELASPPTPLVETRALAEKMRVVFSARGGDREAALALYVLATIEPASTAAHLAELEEIFAFSDELAVAGHGPGAERSRSIEILESTVATAPFPLATTRLLTFYRERHAAVAAIIRAGNLSYEVIGAHGQGVLRSAWHIVRVSALAGNLEAAPKRLADIDGFGDDPELRAALASALATGEPKASIALSEFFTQTEEEGRDLAAAMSIVSWALARHPKDTSLLRAFGMIAAKADRVALAIRLLEAGLEGKLTDRAAAKELAELYEFRITSLSLTSRPTSAASVLGDLETFYQRAAKVWPDFTPDLANAYAAMGRGLLSQGDLKGAETILDRSLGARTTHEALEQLGTLALRTDQYDRATDYFGRALMLPANEPSVMFNQAKVMRLAGEALLGAGKPDQAYGMFLRALDQWRQLRSSEKFQLRPPFSGEALLESGKLLWHLGKRDIALSAFAAAQDAAPGDANTYASIVSFLVVRDRYDAALDAYHRALGSAEVSDYFKVYMSLWMLAESRRAGVAVDPFVEDYLASRNGGLWYDDLAKFASGRIEVAPLEKRATTRAQQAELLYYKAVLGDAGSSESDRQRLLRNVIASRMVMFFEYEMAKHWLERGFAPQ